MTIAGVNAQASGRMSYRQVASLVEAAEKVVQAALVRDAHQLRSLGFSTREAAEALGASKSRVGRAMQVPQQEVPVVNAAVIEAAEAFLAQADQVVSVEVPSARQAPASDVVVFDVMREALTTVRGDYAILQRRAHAAGDAAAKQQVIDATVELARRVDAVNPRDRAEQLSMTQELRDLHTQLRAQIDQS